MLKGHSDTVTSVTFSADGTRVATGSWDNSAKVWNAETGREILTLEGHSHAVSSIAFSPDAKRVLSASWDNTAKIWDASASSPTYGEELVTLPAYIDFAHAAV